MFENNIPVKYIRLNYFNKLFLLWFLVNNVKQFPFYNQHSYYFLVHQDALASVKKKAGII